MNTKLKTIICVLCASLVLCLPLTAFASTAAPETTAELASIDWSNCYASGFSNGLDELPYQSGDGIFDGVAIGNPFNSLWIWIYNGLSSATSFDSSTGVIKYTIASNRAYDAAPLYFVFRGVQVLSAPSNASVVTLEEFEADNQISSSGVAIYSGYQTSHRVADYESELSDCIIYKMRVSTNTSSNADVRFTVAPIPPPSPSLQATVGLVKTLSSEFVIWGNSLVAFVSSNWIMLLSLALWLGVIVTVVILKFTKGS